MKVIKCLRTLKKLEKEFDCKFDRKHRYCLENGNIRDSKEFRLWYMDGCFYPFLIKKF